MLAMVITVMDLSLIPMANQHFGQKIGMAGKKTRLLSHLYQEHVMYNILFLVRGTFHSRENIHFDG